MTGYGPINESLHRRNLSDTNECPKCGTGAIETIDHMIWDCEEYEDNRYDEIRNGRTYENLMDSEEQLRKFNEFARNIFEKRAEEGCLHP